eukprot:2850204-Amphidinium_carterae.1
MRALVLQVGRHALYEGWIQLVGSQSIGLRAQDTLECVCVCFCEDCARMWDAMIADPLRFEFVDYIIIALLLTNRGKLLEACVASQL